MNETIHNKLVRDKIPDIIRREGGEPVTHIAETPEEFLRLLDEKLLEEVQEYLAAPSTEELADILEVLEAIVAIRGIPQPELRRAKNAKQLRNGAFRDRIVLERVIKPD